MENGTTRFRRTRHRLSYFYANPNDGFVVIELKRDQGDDETFGQLSRYMGWIAENKDQPDGAPVRGIIVAAQITPTLEAAAKTNPNVRLVEYAVRLELSPKERADGH